MTLDRPRRLGEIVREALALYGQDARAYLVMAAAVVVPAQLLVLGIGLGQLSSQPDADPTTAGSIVEILLNLVVVGPLVTAMVLSALLERLAGHPPAVRPSMARGFELFAPLMLVVVLAWAGIFLGFAALVVPGVILLARFAVAAPLVVVEGLHGAAAIERSWRLTAGSFWRVLGIVVAVALLGALPGLLLAVPLGALADAADASAVVLLGTIVAGVLSAPFTAIATALLLGDLRARQGGGIVEDA